MYIEFNGIKWEDYDPDEDYLYWYSLKTRYFK